jgi:site-specific recombinase XerD
MGMKWTLDKRKYLDTAEAGRLLEILNREMKRGYQERNYIRVRDWFAVLLGLHSGLRVSEMAALRNMDFQTFGNCSLVHVRKGKGDKDRRVLVSDEFVQAYQEFFRFKAGMGMLMKALTPVICKENSESLCTRTLQLIFKKCARIAGLDEHYSIHCLRHTYGTHLYHASGHNLRLVQEQLGHSSISTTEVYAHVFDEEAQRAIGRLYK